MRTWCHVSPHNPCPICGRPDWCARSADGAWVVCRRVDTGAGIHKIDKAGGEFWLYRLDSQALCWQPTLELPAQPRIERADVVTLDRVYRAFLAMLALSSTHRQALRQRGLTDVEILRRGYRTLLLEGRSSLAKRLVDRFGVDICAQIPGFYMAEHNGRRWRTLAGAPGLLIPVRDLHGRIVALKVRADAPGDGPKYTTISSAKHNGPSPGAQAHVPLHTGTRGNTIRLTEGELKADVATALSCVLTIAIPGVSAWRQALPVLQMLHPQRVLLALDADWRTNQNVARALGHAAYALVQAGYEVRVEDWDIVLAKGVDDVLALGYTPALKPATLAFGAVLRGQARVWIGQLRTVAAEEVPAWR